MQLLESFKPLPTYFVDGVTQSQAHIVVITSDCLPSPHQIAPPPQSDVGEHSHTFFELSHPPTPPALDICANLVCKPTGCHMDLLHQTLSLHFVDPLDCTVLCSSISDSTCVVKKDEVVDGVGVVQPTYAIIHDECVRRTCGEG